MAKDFSVNTCSEQVRIARAKKKMSQVELSAALSVDWNIDIGQRSISYIEKGTRSVKDTELLALAGVLEVHPMWLMFGDNIPEKYR